MARKAAAAAETFAARLAELHAATGRALMRWKKSRTDADHVAFINARDAEVYYLRNHTEAILALVEAAGGHEHGLTHHGPATPCVNKITIMICSHPGALRCPVCAALEALNGS